MINLGCGYLAIGVSSKQLSHSVSFSPKSSAGHILFTNYYLTLKTISAWAISYIVCIFYHTLYRSADPSFTWVYIFYDHAWPGVLSTGAATMHTPPHQDSVTDGNAQPACDKNFVVAQVTWVVNVPKVLTMSSDDNLEAEVGGVSQRYPPSQKHIFRQLFSLAIFLKRRF